MRKPPLSLTCCALTALCLSAAAQTAAREPLDLIPAESLLCWHAQPLPDTAPASDQPSVLQTMLELGTRIAGQKLDPQAQFGVRLAEMFGLMIRHPHALALIDARAKALDNDPQARRVDRLRAVMVVQIGGRDPADTKRRLEPFLRVIQKTVNELTHSGKASLVSKKAGRWSYQELRDEQLPDWAVVGWGQIDGHFVLTIGEHAWAEIAGVADGEGTALADDSWYAVARGKRRRQALIEIFVAVSDIRQRLDQFVQGRASDFFNAWDAGKLERAHWALGFEGRALFCEGVFGFSDKTLHRVYADPSIRDPDLLATIPPEARYAIYRIPVDRFLRRFFSGLVSIQDPKARDNIRRIWAEILAQRGVDPQRDILAHLGQHVVLHNDPPHPLRLPLAMTALIEIRAEPDKVRQTLDALCTGWRDAIDKAAAKSGRPPGVTLHHDDDGVWYLRFGFLDGLAWTTTERFIISSWSPRALREYLLKAGESVTGPPG